MDINEAHVGCSANAVTEGAAAEAEGVRSNVQNTHGSTIRIGSKYKSQARGDSSESDTDGTNRIVDKDRRCGDRRCAAYTAAAHGMESPLLKLQEYALTCNALTDPPYAFPPRVELLLFVLVALQFKQTKLLPWTVTPLTLVESVVLLLEAAQLKNRRKRRRIRRTHWLQMNRN